MSLICKACDLTSHGTKKIFSDPSDLYLMFKLVSRVEVTENDVLCISCCDTLKIAYNFQCKCIQSDESFRKREYIEIKKKGNFEKNHDL